MKFVRIALLTIGVFLGTNQALAQQGQPAPAIPLSTVKTISTPDKLDSPIGKLTFSDGVPIGDTVKTLYDNLDRTRGVTVYLDNLGAVVADFDRTRRDAERVIGFCLARAVLLVTKPSRGD